MCYAGTICKVVGISKRSFPSLLLGLDLFFENREYVASAAPPITKLAPMAKATGFNKRIPVTSTPAPATAAIPARQFK